MATLMKNHRRKPIDKFLVYYKTKRDILLISENLYLAALF